jgi:hypothetical protein
MVEGLSDDSGVDTVFVWQTEVLEEAYRPPRGLADAEPAPRVWSRQECFYGSGQEYGVAHYTLDEWRSWLAELNEGRGTEGYPTPVIAAHGLLSGLLISDSNGLGRHTQEALQDFPDKLRIATSSQVRTALPDALRVLEACARQDDGLLFYGELAKAARLLWLGWFSAQRRYWPLEKRLAVRLRLMGRHDLAQAEERLWASSPNLDRKLLAFRALAEALLSEMPA